MVVNALLDVVSIKKFIAEKEIIWHFTFGFGSNHERVTDGVRVSDGWFVDHDIAGRGPVDLEDVSIGIIRTRHDQAVYVTDLADVDFVLVISGVQIERISKVAGFESASKDHIEIILTRVGLDFDIPDGSGALKIHLICSRTGNDVNVPQPVCSGYMDLVITVSGLDIQITDHARGIHANRITRTTGQDVEVFKEFTVRHLYRVRTVGMTLV